MKSILRLIVIMFAMFPAIGFAQTAKAPTWQEMKSFHSLMSRTFHPSEEGNFAPLKEKADSLFIAAKLWQQSSIPADYKPKETSIALAKLAKKCDAIQGAVHANDSDARLKIMIADAHDIFHTITGECKKTD